MINMEYLEKIKLDTIPLLQKIIALLFLKPNYNFFQKVDIQIKGMHKIPKDKKVIFAMNHTDRFNYWPFQYTLLMSGHAFTTVWVKAEYYRNSIMAKVLDHCKLIPVPSMRYLIFEIFMQKFKRRMAKDEYRFLKDIIDGVPKSDDQFKAYPQVKTLIQEDFQKYILNYHQDIMKRIVDLSIDALFNKNLHLIIFPEGTRLAKLGQARTGLAQLALKTKSTIIPIGSNYCELVYPDNLPWARSGKVVYRVGDPLDFDGILKPYNIKETFEPFTLASKNKYQAQFEAVTNIVMENINELLDQEYRQ